MSENSLIKPAGEIPDELIISQETLVAGNHCSVVLHRGYAIRLTDLDGNANVGALFFNRDEKTERYNMPDTLKAQYTAYLTEGHVCYSDMGRILISVIRDTCGWHDTISGTTNAALIEEKYGSHSYQDFHNEYYRNGRDAFLMQLGRYGLARQDLVPNVNFFSKVKVDESGDMLFEKDHSKPGHYVDLRAEMNVLAVFNTCPHPLNPSSEYPTGRVQLTVWRAGFGGGPDDPCRISRPENERGFQNTEAYFAQRPL